MTFIRRPTTSRPVSPYRAAIERNDAGERADVVLVGCVKQKLTAPAPARDLYISPLFRKARAYAEATGAPWFILSAQHGLVHPDDVLEPYDLRLAKTPRSYRHDWGALVVTKLMDSLGALSGKTIEVHAGAAYSEPLQPGLIAAGAHVVEPLSGLKHGPRLAWYNAAAGVSAVHPPRAARGSPPVPDASAVVAGPRDETKCQSPADFLATKGASMRLPGLYSWWVDGAGARDLTLWLGHPIEPGMIYAGLAGATRARSGKTSSNTLWGRIRGMHLAGNHEFSTFRRSLGSILAAARRLDTIDEAALTDWMHDHLLLIAVPVEDASVLDHLETHVLDVLDPPLNLHKRPTNQLRIRLSARRRQFSRQR